MAADAVWRTADNKTVGVCMATSGPGVNLLSGLGCSYEIQF